MKPFSTSRILSFLSLALLPVVSALPARAQTARTVYLYNSSFGQGAGVVADARTGAWGNGTFQNSNRTKYEGLPSLQVTTRSFAEGIRFDLTQPVDPTPYMNNGFVRMRLKFNEIGGGGGMDGGRGGFPGMGGGSPGRGGGRGGMMGGGMMGGGMMGLGELVPRWNGNAQLRGGALPGLGGDPRLGGGDPRMGGGFPGMGGEGGMMPTGPLPQTTYIKEFKVTFLRDQGAMTGRFSVNLNSDDNKPDDNGWRLYTIAFKNMVSTPGASGPVRRVILTSDVQDTFYLAQLALVVETGQMTVSIRTPDKPVGTQMAEVQWRPGTPLSLVADVEAGAADPQVEWNFDADNVGNLPLPAVNGGGIGPDGNPITPGMGGGDMEGDPRSQLGLGGRGGDPRMGGGTSRLGGGDPRNQLGLGGGRIGGGEGGDGGATQAFVGPRIDARGLSAQFSYPNEEQDYRVEVTVTDRSGKKQPVKASILVRIRG